MAGSERATSSFQTTGAGQEARARAADFSMPKCAPNEHAVIGSNDRFERPASPPGSRDELGSRGRTFQIGKPTQTDDNRALRCNARVAKADLAASASATGRRPRLSGSVPSRHAQRDLQRPRGLRRGLKKARHLIQAALAAGGQVRRLGGGMLWSAWLDSPSSARCCMLYAVCCMLQQQAVLSQNLRLLCSSCRPECRERCTKWPGPCRSTA